MKYTEGAPIGICTILAVIYSAWQGAELPRCLAIGTCIGLAADFAVRGIARMFATRRAKASERNS